MYKLVLLVYKINKLDIRNKTKTNTDLDEAASTGPASERPLLVLDDPSAGWGACPAVRPAVKMIER